MCVSCARDDTIKLRAENARPLEHRCELHYSLIRDGLRFGITECSPRTPTLQMTTTPLVAANNAAYRGAPRERDGDIMYRKGSACQDARKASREVLGGSPTANWIELVSRALFALRKSHHPGHSAPRGRVRRESPAGTTVDYPGAQASPALCTFAEKPTVIIHSLWPLRTMRFRDDKAGGSADRLAAPSLRSRLKPVLNFSGLREFRLEGESVI